MTNTFKSRHLVEPEALEFLEGAARPPLTLTTLPAVREYARTVFSNRPGQKHNAIVARELRVAGLNADPDLRVIVFEPTIRPQGRRPAVLHIHGGGYVAGSIDAEAEWSEWLVNELQCVVIAPDYRLSPETSFPGPVHDCYAALRWLHQHADEWQIDPARVCVFGGSAGGGLATAVALMARDRGEHPVSFQCLLYPMLDDRTGTGTQANPYAGEYIWTPEDNAFAWQCYLAAVEDQARSSPYAAPARAESVENLAPTFIWVGALDLFVDECIEWARRLIRAGVPTELHIQPGVTHGNILLPDVPSSRICRATVLDALRRATAVRSSLHFTPGTAESPASDAADLMRQKWSRPGV